MQSKRSNNSDSLSTVAPCDPAWKGRQLIKVVGDLRDDLGLFNTAVFRFRVWGAAKADSTDIAKLINKGPYSAWNKLSDSKEIKEP